jgi:autotransporter-associated beta strand protein
MNANHTVAGFFNGPLTPDPCTVTIVGTGIITLPANTFQGCDVTTDGASDPGVLTIAVPIAGTGAFGDGLCAEGSGAVYLNAINTYSDGSYLGYVSGSFTGTWGFTNADTTQPGICTSFGTGGIYLSNCYGTLAVEGTSAVTVTNSVYHIMPASFAAFATLNINGNPAGVTFSGPWALSGSTFSKSTVLSALNIGSVGAANNLVTISGVMSGTNGFTKSGIGILALSAANTYSGNTLVTNGTLALTGSGSINNSPLIVITTNATLDVSGVTGGAFTLSSSTALMTYGVGATAGTSSATINGPAGGTVNLGSQPLTLVFSPASSSGDATHPSLNIPQGALTLNNNQIVVSNATSTPLGAGTYSLIQVGDGTTGTISGTPSSSVLVDGGGLAAGMAGTLVINGSTVNLVVAAPSSTTTITPVSAITYGQSTTFTATLSPVPDGGEVQFFINNALFGSPVAVNTSTGVATSAATSTSLAAGTYTVIATYGGSPDNTSGPSAATSVSQVVSKAPLSVTASAQSTTYGTSAPLTGNTHFTSSGLQNSETIGSVSMAVTATPPYSTNTPPGSYTITPSAATGGTFSAANYTITYNAANLGLTVNPKALTITASATSKPYGSAPAGTLTGQTAFASSGLVNGQTNSSITVTLTYNGSSVDSPVSASPFTITPSAAVEASGKTNFNPANYTITYANGNLTITNLSVRLTGTQPYGNPWVEANSLTVSNAVAGDPVNVVLGLGLLASSNPGVQNIASPATLVLGNAGDQGSGTGTGAGAQFNAPTGIAVDANDNVYVADTANNRIVEMNSGGVETALGFTGLTDPSGVAVDSAGDVFVTDPILNEVVVLPFGGTQSNLPITGLNYPVGIAVDANNDVFVADTLNSRIVEYAANGAQSTLPFSGIATLYLPSGVTVDTNGDVYVANAGSNNIVELSATGVQTVVPFSGLNFATGVAVDTSSNIYAVNYGGGNVKKMTAGTVSTPAFTSLANPAGITVDANGNLFVSDSAHDRIAEFSGGVSSSFAGTIGVPNYTITGAGGTVTNTDTPVFSNLSSQSVNYGASVTLTGTLSGPGPTYPASGTLITATADGIQGSGAISGSAGAFSINFNTTGIPASVTPYTVTYTSAKAGAFFPASDASTTLTVNPATVTITSGLTVNPVTYGSLNGLDAASLSSNNVVLAGVIAQDAGNVELDTNGYTATFTDTNASPDVPVTVSGLTLTGSAVANYSLVQPALTGTINPATLTYTANPATRAYGAPNPTFSGTVSGFVDGETQNSATTGTLVFSTPASLDSPAGSYAINGSGLSAANYTFAQAPGNATALTITAEGSGIDLWIGGNADTNWSNPANWSLDEFPGSATPVIFSAAGAASGSPYSAFGEGFGGITTPANFDSAVDSGFGGTISSLMITNVNSANNWQNILIADGGALNITGSGGFTVGNGVANVDFGDSATPTATIGGSLGTLSVNNTNSRVWVTEGSVAQNACAFLDLSGLGYFNATVSQFWVSVSDSEANADYPGGVMYLAATNNIIAEYSTTASETSSTAGTAAFVVGDTSGSNGTNSYLYLGQNNTITADTIFTAREQFNAATIAFNPYLPNLNSPIGPPTATFKGYSANAVSIFSVGDGAATSGTASCNGTDDFSGGVVNATIGTLNVGRAGSNSSGAGDCIGVLNFSAGTITAETCYLGYQPTANTAGEEGTGTINVSTNEAMGTSGVLSITGSLVIGQNATLTNATGTLNVTNGTVMANSIVCGATASNSVINMVGGTLYLTNQLGAPGAPLMALNLSNATIHLNLIGSGGAPLTNIVASNIAVMPDTTATIVFDSIANVSSTPYVSGTLTFPLISYSGADPIAGLVLGALPPNYTSGSLIDNTADNRIDLQVTYTPPALLIWSGTVNSDWDLTTLNWDDGSEAYANSDFVQFDDTAATGNVEVAATVSPATILVTNNTLNYVFSTSGGSITGPATLTKEGTATLTFTDSGDDFIGDIIAGQGLLVLDQPETLSGNLTIDSGANAQAGDNDANGNLPAGNVVDNGGLTFDRTDNPTVGNLISGSGTLTQDGPGTLTLTAVNSFSGSTIINGGTVALTGAGSLANSSVTINSGGTLDVSGLTSTSYTMGGTSFTASGDAAATINGAAGGTVSLGTMPVTLNYNGSAPALTISQGTLVFDGNAFIINGPPLADGDYSGIISGNVSGTVGSVSGTAIGAGMSGSLKISGGTLVLTIVNATTVTLSGGAPTPYGSPLSITATVSPAPPDGESIVFATNGTAFLTNTTSGGAATLTSSTLPAGTYSVTAMYVGDSTNTASTSQPLSQVVTPVTLIPTVRVASGKPYDGTTAAMIAARSLSGYVAGDSSSTVNLGSSGVANYSDPNVGTAKTVTITGLALSGSHAGDYVLSSTTASTTANITAAGVTVVSGVVANNKVYDDTNTATLSLSNAVVLAGLIGSDAGTVTLSTNGYAAVFTNSNVGTNIPVTVTGLTLTGGDYTNYGLTQPTLSADITPATLTYVATDTNLNYGSTITNFAGTVTGFVGGNTLLSATAGTLEFTGTNTPTTPVGSYPITGSGLTASNYVFVQAAGNATALTITSSIPATLSVSLSATQLTISWPPAYVGYTLETNSSDISNPADWYPYAGSTTASGEVITIDPSQTNVFFRLVGP